MPNCTMDQLKGAVVGQLQCLLCCLTWLNEWAGGYGPGTSFTEVQAHPLHFFIPGDLTGLQVDSSKDRVVVDDAPDAVSDLLEPDVFSLERIAQGILPGVKAERAARAHSADLEVTRVFGFSKTAGVCLRGWLPPLGRKVPIECVVRTLVVVALLEEI